LRLKAFLCQGHFMSAAPSGSPTHSSHDIVTAKALMRKDAASRRAALMSKQPEAPQHLAGFAAALIESFGVGVYAAYLPIRSELSPIALVGELVAAGMTTVMPITPEPENPLSFHQWAPGMPLAEGPYGTKQPPSANTKIDPDVILAPMLAFDAGCWRLGYGGGFYDRTIANLRDQGRDVRVIGLAFSGQKVAAVPTGPYDMALDAVLTPEGLVWPVDRDDTMKG
jgi:5-formyltetrahydrofolate cyclo-ligase